MDDISPLDFRTVTLDLLRSGDGTAGYQELWDEVFQGHVFGQWAQGKLKHLRCSGSLRCGKTTFTASAAKHLRERYRETVVIVPIFLGLVHVRSRAEDNRALELLDVILHSILRQLLENRSAASEEVCLVAGALDVQSAGEWTPDTLTVVKELIQIECNACERIVVLCDSLDDFPALSQKTLVGQLESVGITSVMFVGSPRNSLVPDWVRYCRKCWDTRRISVWADCATCTEAFCSTCNQKDHVHHRLSELSSMAEIDIEPPKQVVQMYVEGCLRNMYEDSENRKSAIEAVVSETHGSFALSKLAVNSLSDDTTLEDLITRQEGLPVYQSRCIGLGLWRLRNQSSKIDANLAITSVAIMALAGNGAMTVHELISTLYLLDPGLARYGHPLSLSRLSRVTQGWLIAKGDENNVYFHAATIREYIHNGYRGFYKRLLYDGRPMLPYGRDFATLCLRALLQSSETPDNLDHISRQLKVQGERTTFLGYALRNWGRHLREYSTPETIELACYFLDNHHEYNHQFQWFYFSLHNHLAVGSGLHIIARLGLTEVLQEYIHRDVDLNVVDDATGHTPIMIACQAGHEGFVKKMVQANADLSLRSKRGLTVLHMAVQSGRIDLVRSIMVPGNGGLVNIQDQSGETAMMLAVRLWATESKQEDFGGPSYGGIAKDLLDHSSMRLQLTNDLGKTALHIAAELCHSPSIYALLTRHDCREAIDQPEGTDVQRTALLNTLDADLSIPTAERKRALETLIKQGASVSLKDGRGRMALHYAALSNSFAEIVPILVAQVKDIHSQDHRGWTSLHTAYAHGCDLIVEALISAGADESITDDMGLTPALLMHQSSDEHATGLLQKITAAGTAHVVESIHHLDFHNVTILANGSDPDRSTEANHHSPDQPPTSSTQHFHSLLHHAISNSTHHGAVLPLLHDTRLNIHALNYSGDTALHIALSSHNTHLSSGDSLFHPVFTTLITHPRTDFTIRNSRSERPLDLALRICGSDTYSIVLDLLEAGAEFDEHDPQPGNINGLFREAVLRRENPSAELMRKLIAAGADVYLPVKHEEMRPRRRRRGVLASEVVVERGLGRDVREVIEGKEEEIWRWIRDGVRRKVEGKRRRDPRRGFWM